MPESKLTRDEAVAMADSRWWKDKTDEEIVRFQLFESRLCMDFGDYQASVERVLGHPVFTHQFATCCELLVSEFNEKYGETEPG